MRVCVQAALYSYSPFFFDNDLTERWFSIRGCIKADTLVYAYNETVLDVLYEFMWVKIACECTNTLGYAILTILVIQSISLNQSSTGPL